MRTRARLVGVALLAAWKAGGAVAAEIPPETVVRSAWVQGLHAFADLETWLSSSAVSGDSSGLAGTDVSARPGYGFRIADVYLVGRAHAVLSTIWHGGNGPVRSSVDSPLPLEGVERPRRKFRVGWSDPAVALSAPALFRSEASPVTASPTFGFTIPASSLSPATRLFAELRAAVDLPSTRWAASARAERIFGGEQRPLPIDSFQREFSCATQNLECLFQRPARESWSARVTALVELRTPSIFTAGARMSFERVGLQSVGPVAPAPSNVHDALTFSVHGALRFTDVFGLVVTVSDAGRLLSPGHPLRLPFIEASESFLSLALWIRTNPALEPFHVDPFGA